MYLTSYSLQDIEEVDEEEISGKAPKKSRSSEEGRKVVYKIPDSLDESSEYIHVTRNGPRLTVSDLEEGDYPSWLISKAASTITPFYLATQDPFPDRGTTEATTFCAMIFNLAFDKVMEDAPDVSDTEAADVEENLSLQLQARKTSYSNRATFRYRIEMNKLVYLQCGFCFGNTLIIPFLFGQIRTNISTFRNQFKSPGNSLVLYEYKFPENNVGEIAKLAAGLLTDYSYTYEVPSIHLFPRLLLNFGHRIHQISSQSFGFRGQLSKKC